MKTAIFVLLLSFLVPLGFADDFKRNLPDAALLSRLTPERFPGQDAIIILKEQGFSIHEASVSYRGDEYSGPATTMAKIMIVKMLTEAGASRYGSFEYTYPEWYGNELRSGFEAHVRVMKKDGSVYVMPEKEMKTIVSRETSDGVPLERKVLFKIANLNAGDVLQIEQVHTEPLARTSSGIFFYNDRDIVLFSNLAITLPSEDKVRYFSFPEEQVGRPQVSEAVLSTGTGETYSWSMKNLNPIPDESYALPFADQSFMTAFVDDPPAETGFRSVTDWILLAKDFSERYLDKDPIKAPRIAELGFAPVEEGVTIDKADRLYEALRKAVALRPLNSLYPLSKDIDEVFKKKSGDASDLAYIMYTILKQWKQQPEVVWIRDRRQGAYEQAVPSPVWFDRMGVLLKIGGQEKVYDFDRSIPARYDMPWFLSGISVPVIGKASCYHKQIRDLAGVTDHFARERHALRFTGGMELRDSIVYECKGSIAEQFRKNCYEDDPSQLQARMKGLAGTYCLASLDTLWCNKVLEEPVTEMCFVGKPKASPSAVESFLTMKLTNHALDDFYGRVSSATRISDVMLSEPFTISVGWSLAIPKGYALQECPENATFQGPCGMAGMVKVDKGSSRATMAMEVRFPNVMIPQPNYKDMVGFLDKMRSAVGKDVVLKKL